MKTTLEDFQKTSIYKNLVSLHKEDPGNKENFLLAIKTAFLVGRQLGLNEARDIVTKK